MSEYVVIAGIDPSMNSSALVKFYLDKETLEVVKSDFLAFTSKKKDITDKVIFFKREMFDNSIEKNGFCYDLFREFLSDVEYVSIEDYAYGSQNGMTFDIGEFVGGVKNLVVLDCKCKMRIYDIPSIKKFTTGVGSADKYEMWVHVKESKDWDDLVGNEKLPLIEKRTGAGTTSDIVDAFAIAKFLQKELQLRKGLIELKSLKEYQIEMFNRTTLKQVDNILTRDFIFKK